jgi:hypothetical protein
MRARRLALGLALSSLTGSASSALAQAWPLPEKTGAVSLVYQWINNTGHRLSDGVLLDDGKSHNQGLALAFDYGVTRKLSVSVGIPFVSAKFLGPNLPPVPPEMQSPNDIDGEWHSGLQDFALSARYNAVSHGAFVLTPAVALVIPSHSYAYRGEAVLGRRLKELHLGVSLGRTLDEISSNLYISARYAYAFVEQAEVDVANNRSNAAIELGFLPMPKLTLQAACLWQRTHGGLRFGTMPPGTPVFPGDVNTPERTLEHDRLLRDNSFHLAGGASYSFEGVDVFAQYIAYVSGTDTHAGYVVSAGITWYFNRPGSGRDERSR